MFTIKSANLVTEKRIIVPSNQECPICWHSIQGPSLSNFSKGLQSTIVITKCGHAFHQDCISSWISNNPSCPICSNKWEVDRLIKFKNLDGKNEKED